jgi:hypothetical protein
MAQQGVTTQPGGSRVLVASSGGPVGRSPGLLALAGLVALCSWLVALAIGAAIGLHVWDHGAVAPLQAVARWLVGPFIGVWGSTWHGLNALIANWGTAAAVYLVGGHLIAGMLRRLAVRRVVI